MLVVRPFGFFFALLAWACPAPAREAVAPQPEAWRIDSQPAPADRSRAASGDFAVSMMVTADYEGFWKAWEGPSPPNVTVTDTAERGRPVHAMILFTGCKAAANGNCDVVAGFSLTGPDGKAYGTPTTGQVWSGPPAPARNLQLSAGSLGLVVEPHDPLGRYTLKATVTDRVAGLSLPVERAVTAVDSRR